MKAKDLLFFTSLAALAIFIWLRDTHWMSSSEDTLPALVAIPVFIWLGWPWNFRKDWETPSQWLIVSSVILFLAGIALNLTIFLATSWTILLWTWLSIRLEEDTLTRARKLLILPLLAFPWITLDAAPLGWWFRLSGAWTAGHFFSLLGANVEQMGTNLIVNGLPISVDAACAGLNTLQSMLIAGTFVAFVILGDTNRYWWSIPQLILFTWIANTLRIIVLVITALAVNVPFAMGAFHTFGGWIVVMFMFALCWGVFTIQEPARTKAE